MADFTISNSSSHMELYCVSTSYFILGKKSNGNENSERLQQLICLVPITLGACSFQLDPSKLSITNSFQIYPVYLTKSSGYYEGCYHAHDDNDGLRTTKNLEG